ncbi:glutathione peroxidase [Paludibacterium sp. THUN1379]|uniref:glutathione peroxidase n=1 Tax=Paludibacterium sp. THUN1379 TaxID=3112107 RepID=UPI003088A8DC|nr:glutathione peroxidase [Paludibacterium sp. THUN1379]
MTSNLLRHPIVGLDGQRIDPASLQGKVLLLVNTASQCGFTPQFAALQALHERFAARGLVVVGFPCNQFGKQDPGSNQQIGAFCQKNFGVSFPMAARIEVNGPQAHPLWRELKQARRGVLGLGRIHWNFTKFLVNRQGQVVGRFAPFTRPEKLAARIEALL